MTSHTTLIAIATFLLIPFRAFAEDALPEDVKAFQERREGCDHWSGEPYYEGDTSTLPADERKMLEDRKREIIQNIDDLCPGLDKALQELKTKYKDDKTIMDVLKQYEEEPVQ